VSSIADRDWSADEKEQVFSGTAFRVLANVPARLAHVI